MTLAFLQSVKRQLDSQRTTIATTTPTDASQAVLQHANLLQMLGASQLIDQLIRQEEVLLAAPPGATGPEI